MTVLQLIDETHRNVPATAPFGTRWKGTCRVTTPHGTHAVAVAARIDARGHRREQFWCNEVRVDHAVLLRLTCQEAECPHAIEVRAQWQAFHRRGPARPPRPTVGPQPLMADIPVVVGRHHIVARPARFPCFTPCPHGAHPPLNIDKSGFDLFEEGVCLGGGVTELGGVLRPRIPSVSAAEAFVLARHLEALAALGQAAHSSRADGAWSIESLKWAVRDARDGMRCKARSTAMPMGIASIRNAAACPYRVDSTDPISVIQWTSSRRHRRSPRSRTRAIRVAGAPAARVR